MSKKKAIICTILFSIIIIAITIGTFFIKSDYINLGVLIGCTVYGFWIADCIKKFNRWLME